VPRHKYTPPLEPSTVRQNMFSPLSIYIYIYIIYIYIYNTVWGSVELSPQAPLAVNQ
jgi:quinol-cytochrome oxidoreductase complex cytochrome b subunit